MTMAEGVQVLEEPPGDKVVSEEEVIEYAEFLGIDPASEQHLMWIARDGVATPCPPPWKACTQNGEDVFYFNFETGDSLWDHPCDDKFRKMVEDERLKSGNGTVAGVAPVENLTSGGAGGVRAEGSEVRSITTKVPETTSSEAARCNDDETASSPDSLGQSISGSWGEPKLSRQHASGKKSSSMKSPEDLQDKMRLITAEISADEDSSAAEDDEASGGVAPSNAAEVPAAVSRKRAPRPPELSQLDLSGQSLGSSKAGVSQDLGLSLSGLGSSLDLSITADAIPDMEKMGQKASHEKLTSKEKLAADVEALTRCLGLLQGVRQQQEEYLRLIRTAA